MILLVIPLSFALVEEEENLYPGDSYNFEGYNVFLSISSNNEKILIQADDSPYFIDLGLSNAEFQSYKVQGREILEYDPQPAIETRELNC